MGSDFACALCLNQATCHADGGNLSFSCKALGPFANLQAVINVSVGRIINSFTFLKAVGQEVQKKWTLVHTLMRGCYDPLIGWRASYLLSDNTGLFVNIDIDLYRSSLLLLNLIMHMLKPIYFAKGFYKPFSLALQLSSSYSQGKTRPLLAKICFQIELISSREQNRVDTYILFGVPYYIAGQYTVPSIQKSRRDS